MFDFFGGNKKNNNSKIGADIIASPQIDISQSEMNNSSSNVQNNSASNLDYKFVEAQNNLINNMNKINELLMHRCDMLEKSLQNITVRPIVVEAPIYQDTEAFSDYHANNKPQDFFENSHIETDFITQLQQLGSIAPLMEDESVNDILINGHRDVFVERFGKLEKTDIRLSCDNEVILLAERIAGGVGRRLDPRRPLLDTRLINGSRVNIIAPPLAVDGTTISIRKFTTRKLGLDEMVVNENMSQQVADILKVIGRCRLNVVISGGTGSGKTTLLNAISQYIDFSERIVSIEDAAELRLQQPHVVRLETRPLTTGITPYEEVTMRDLVKNALRMRPDRIIVGEVRGAEAFDMLQAMNTGHEGSLTTVHANHPRDGLSRLENMIRMANFQVPTKALREQITSAVNVFVQISRMRDGRRRVTQVSEIVGMETDVITMQDLFKFDTTGEDEKGNLKGRFIWTGIMPRFLRRAKYYGQEELLSSALGVKLPKY